MNGKVFPKLRKMQQEVRLRVRLTAFFSLVSITIIHFHYNELFYSLYSSTLEMNMKNAKLMETMSLILLLLVGLLSPIIILLVKNATSTIQVCCHYEDLKIIAFLLIEFRKYFGG